MNPMTREIVVDDALTVPVRVVSQHPDDDAARELLYALDTLNDWIVERQKKLTGRVDLVGLARALLVVGIADAEIAGKVAEESRLAAAQVENSGVEAVKVARELAKADTERDKMRRELLRLVLNVPPSELDAAVAAVLKQESAGGTLMNDILDSAWGFNKPKTKGTPPPPDSKPATSAS